MVQALEAELAGYEERIDAIGATIGELAENHRDQVTSVLAYWETRREVITSQERGLESKRMALVAGYVLAREAGDVTRKINGAFPETAVTLEDPSPRDEAVPVELRTSRLFAPAQFLTRMFGLPPYQAFDPSPFATFNFLLFFGFCFGDVIYGLGLIALALYIALRVKRERGCYHFFTLMALGGISATIVGVLTGAWAGDLPLQIKKAFGIGVWNDIREGLMLADPLAKPVIALLVALGVGILNQFYGIVLRIYREVRREDYAAAIFDGGLWFLVLPGLIMAVTALFSPPVPIAVAKVGLWIFLVGAAGLVLTQGRHEESLAGKIVVGVVSVYGILGTYGATGFIGDTLSYSRLLALGLTTTILGVSFNMLARLASGAPYVGAVIFVVIVAAAHVFNFLINILGGFVHSVRLIFVEFFGRFYESGGEKFHPLGTSERVRVAGEQA